ncbi:MAG: hypothetical protein LYZ70_05750 [Nitrososphaerales archaeon]|nr:hypothetical protein [Nitrososphaerales archaeon]
MAQTKFLPTADTPIDEFEKEASPEQMSPELERMNQTTPLVETTEVR